MELESERIRLSISSCSPYPSTKLYVSCFRCIHAGNCTGFVFDIVTRRCSLFLPSDNSVVNIGTIQGDIFLSSGKHTINQFQNWKRHAVICQQIILEPDRLYLAMTRMLKGTIFCTRAEGRLLYSPPHTIYLILSAFL